MNATQKPRMVAVEPHLHITRPGAPALLVPAAAVAVRSRDLDPIDSAIWPGQRRDGRFYRQIGLFRTDILTSWGAVAYEPVHTTYHSGNLADLDADEFTIAGRFKQPRSSWAEGLLAVTAQVGRDLDWSPAQKRDFLAVAYARLTRRGPAGRVDLVDAARQAPPAPQQLGLRHLAG